MKTYVQKDIEGYYINAENIDANFRGFTYDDFLNGKYIELSEDKINYHNDNLEADVKTVLNVAIYKDGVVTWHIAPVVMTLEYAKELKINQLMDYDSSNEVNDFIINDTIHAWFTPEERTNYKSSIESAKLLGVGEVQIFIENVLFALTVNQAETMLARIQLYADYCYNVTIGHKIAIENLTTIEDVQNYDYKTKYPDKIRFELNAL
jgi:hypothetical protein